MPKDMNRIIALQTLLPVALLLSPVHASDRQNTQTKAQPSLEFLEFIADFGRNGAHYDLIEYHALKDIDSNPQQPDKPHEQK